MGHFVALGPLTFLNLNILTIWVRDHWVSIQITFWGSLPPTKEVQHTCKIVNYFVIADLLLARGDQIVREGVTERGWGQEGWGKADGAKGVG